MFLPVTPRRTRALGRTESRSVTVALPLTKLGRRLFAKLAANEQRRQLPVQVDSAIRDRDGRTIAAVFRALLERRR